MKRKRNDLSKKELSTVIKIAIFLFLIIVLGAAAILFFESGNEIKNYFDAIWWALVTITTVGYGDIYPITFWGRIIGIIFILLGFIAFSAFTAYIAGYLIDKRIKERKGLSNIKDRNHLIICGWNNSASNTLDHLHKQLANFPVVLVNDHTEEFFSTLQNSYPDLDLRFIKGDFSNRDIMFKANFIEAKHIILLFDESTPNITPSDERTVIAAQFITYEKYEGILSVQLKNRKYLPNLQKDKIRNIIIFDELGGKLLASSTLHPSIPDFIGKILKPEDNEGLHEIAIPVAFIGKEYSELFEAVLAKQKKIPLGIVSLKPEFSIHSILSDDSAGIDTFIKQQFNLSDKKFSTGKTTNIVKIKPDDDYIIQSNDRLIVL